MANKDYKYKLVKKVDETSATMGSASFSPGTGAQYATPFAFKKTKKQSLPETNPGADLGPGPKAGPKGVTDNTYVKNFKYKLVNQPALNKVAKGIEIKQLWETIEVEDYLNALNISDPSRREFLTQRLEGFNILEKKLNQLVPLLQQARNKTLDYYKNNPKSYAVIYSTDSTNELLDDIINSFTPEDNIK